MLKRGNRCCVQAAYPEHLRVDSPDKFVVDILDTCELYDKGVHKRLEKYSFIHSEV